MSDFSHLELFGRRDFIKGGVAAGLLPFGLKPKKSPHPIKDVGDEHFETLVAIVRTQIDSLWCGRQGDNACQVARDILTYMCHVPIRVQRGFKVALIWLNLYSLKHYHKSLHKLSPREIRQLLNQGEERRVKNGPPLILWEQDHLLHTAVAGLAMVCRLVLYSRTPARNRIDLSWSKKCSNPELLVTVPTPALADLSNHYDVCVIGSGAGGATVANRLSAAGKRVLMIDVGDYHSPDSLIQKQQNPDGTVSLTPPRGDQVLYKLYKSGAAQISGGLSDAHSAMELILPNRRKKIPPKQSINVCQAWVFGGGPYVNNAIHLPMSREIYDQKWAGRQPTNLPYDSLAEVMNSINNELGVTANVTKDFSSDRSERFAEGCRALGEEVQPMPVSIRRDCSGCGSDNSVDSFGDHVGGIHPYSPAGPNSFLVQAMNNPVPVDVSYRTAANRIRVHRDDAGGLRVHGVDVTHRHESGRNINSTIKADEYVVAAGIGASTRLVGTALASGRVKNRHLGTRLSANVGTAMYAMFDKPIWTGESERPEPGVTQCFLVDRKSFENNGQQLEEPALENWFHFPGTVALALSGWFKESACVMQKFNHLSMAGIVVPTQVRPSNYVDRCGNVEIQLDCNEFEMLLLGMRRIARIYFAATKPDDGVTLHMPTKAVILRGGRPLRIRNMADFEYALCVIRKRGAPFLNLLTTHSQGGVSLGEVLDPESFRVKTDCDELIQNLTVADSSVFPAGCEINPQLTLKALSTVASHRLIQRMDSAHLPAT